jgi:hypothetical protein
MLVLDMILSLTVFVVLTSTSCAPHHTDQLQITGFETQVHAFEMASNQVGHPITISDLIIQFDPSLPLSNEDGRCTTFSNATPVIRVSPIYWNAVNDQGREALLFHELGHCILYRVHRNDVQPDGVPNSIMYYSAGVYYYNQQDYSFYQNNRQEYINELFNGAGVPK